MVFVFDEIGVFFLRYWYIVFKVMILNYFCVKFGFVYLYCKKLIVYIVGYNDIFNIYF